MGFTPVSEKHKNNDYSSEPEYLFFKHGGDAFAAAETDAAGRAYPHAGRTHFCRQAIDAKIALDSNLLFVIKLHGAERTDIHTFPTPDAPIRVDQHDALFIPGNCLYRTGLSAGRFCTMVAINGKKIRTLFDHPDKPRSHPQFVLLLAGNLTGMASHASFFIEHHSDLFHFFSS